MKQKVIILERTFAFYRKPVYDLINQKVELKVLHGRNNAGIKQASTLYSEQIPSFQYAKNETNVCLFPFHKILKFKPQVVISDFALGILNLPFIMLACKLIKIKFIFWSHGYNRKTGFHPERKLIDKYRLLLLRAADANIVYGQFDKQVLEKYIDKERIFVAQNTIDILSQIPIRKKLEDEGRLNVKKRVGISHIFNIIFSSRMLRAKKPELLIDIYETLKNKYNIVVGVHFLGDGEMLSAIKNEVQKKSYANDFYFHGTIYDPVISGTLLYVCDVMVIPGDLGLSVNHSFCFDCPVISFKQKNGFPSHGPEIEYLINHKTGFLIEEHTAEAIADGINALLMKDELRIEFKKNIRNMIEKLTLENMVAGVIDCINYLDDKSK